MISTLISNHLELDDELASWLIDTALFKSLAPGRSQSLRVWLETHAAPVYLSTASLVEIEAAIAKASSIQIQKGAALRNWLEGLVSGYGDRIHPIDAKIALRAGALLSHCKSGQPRHRFHDALLVATAQVHGHGLLTKRDAVFGAWAKITIATP